MGFTVVAVVAGVVFGLVCGGRPSNIRRRHLELVWLLTISVALQIAAELLDLSDSVGLALVLLSYVGLGGFAVANIKLVGMPIVLVGLLCNIVVITANAGMPVDTDALLAARVATPDEVASLDLGAKRHLATDGDVLQVLGDVVPVRASREVLSFGDLILAFGIADVLFRLLRPVELRRRDDDDVLDLVRLGEVSPAATRQLVDA
jgi:hypothetical protein